MFFESFWLNFTIALALIIALTFDYVTKFFSYWYVRHIPYKTSVPFYGSDYHRVIGLRNTTEEVNSLYYEHKEDFVGSIKSRIPDLLIKNPDVIKEVLSTEFESFKSRGLELDKSQDVCLRNNLFYAEGEKWTFLREGLESVLNDMTYGGEGLKECLSGTSGNTNVKDLLTTVLDFVFARMLLEDGQTSVISEMRYPFLKRTFSDKLKFYLKNIFPSLYTLFGLSTVSSVSNKNIQSSRISQKIENVFKTNTNSKNIKLKHDEIVQGALYSFITEGYISCLNAMTALFYELAKRKDVQQNIRNSDEYLDAAIKESLRLYPSYSVITRKCVKTYKFQDSKMLVDRGVTVNIPVAAIQKDDAFYKHPEEFKPERFLDSASLVHSYAFLPFGAGPRKCIGPTIGHVSLPGCRYDKDMHHHWSQIVEIIEYYPTALHGIILFCGHSGEEISVKILQKVTKAVLNEFEIDVTEKTPTSLKIVDHDFGRMIEGDVWLKFKPIL